MKEFIALLLISTTCASAVAQDVEHSGYIQFQFTSSGKAGEGSGFFLRRIYLTQLVQLDDRTSFKFQTDWVGGENRIDPYVKEAILNFELSEATLLRMGQYSVPLGYELERSSSARETPERATYNSVLFSGEGIIGAGVEHEAGPWRLEAGVANPLTFRDKEQLGADPANVDTVAGYAAATYSAPWGEAGLSGIVGERPAFMAAPSVDDRHFVYAHLVLDEPVPKVEFRAEAMMGHDRVPGSGGPATDMTAAQAQIAYAASEDTLLFTRYSSWDFSGVVNELSVGARWDVTSANAITLAFEWFDDSRSSDPKYTLFTLRWQSKF